MREDKENRTIPAAYSLLYCISYIFLPPKLLQEDNADITEDLALTEECKTAVESLLVYLPTEDHSK
jgi:hypothetical protein